MKNLVPAQNFNYSIISLADIRTEILWGKNIKHNGNNFQSTDENEAKLC